MTLVIDLTSTDFLSRFDKQHGIHTIEYAKKIGLRSPQVQKSQH